MHPLTVAAFTAIHALCHRIELTRAETELLDVEGASLSPDVWQCTLSLLADADGAGEGATLHLGYDRLVLAWLGCRDEADCRERHGLSLADALASDRGSLFVAARSVAGDREITTDRAQEALVLLVKVWAERAARLAGTGADAVSVSIASFDRAVSVCPLPEETTRALWTAFIGACEVTGNRTLAGLARERLKSRRDANEDGEDGLELVVVLVCSVLWAVTHDEYVLRCEHGLDRHVERSPDAWDRIREGVAEGRIDDVPLPVESFAAWCPGPGLDADELSGCIRSCEMATLAEILATVQAVWSGEGDPDSLPPTALALVCETCRMRRIRIDRDYEPVPGERRNIYYELQGARRPEALERLDLMRRLNGVLARYGSVNPDLRMCVARDLAAESESRGEHDATRQHLEEVRRAAVLVDDAGRREYAQVCLALHCWQRGDLDRAAGLIAAVSSDQAADLRVSLSNAQTARDALDAAVAACRTAPDVARWAAVAHAEMVAGHSIAGERTAQALTRAYPGRSLAWTTLARVRHEHGRHRDAIEPARVAVRLAAGAPTDLALLARILARIGEDGREESLELAERVIVEMVRVGSGPVPALASMADVIGRYADCDRSSLRHALAADDLIWARSDSQDLPAEWIGAAASRRCQTEWAPDAVLWLGRLAAASDSTPAALARWVVDRVDALQNLRSRIGSTRLGPSRSSGETGAVSDPRPVSIVKRGSASIHLEAVHVALQSARSLGYPLEEAVGELGLCVADLAALESTFGIGLVSQLRASQAAQRAIDLLGSDEEGTAADVSVVLAVLESEQIEWIRWAVEQPELRQLQADGSDLTADARDRLVRVIHWSTLDDPGTVVPGTLLGNG